jgi:AcrR family transcriptional regulator
MTELVSRRLERKTRQRAANRNAILDAARRVAARDGAGNLALRAVAAEAGYAPASVYEYFRNRAELVLALAADDMGALARVLRETAAAENQAAAHPDAKAKSGPGRLGLAARAALEQMRVSGALPAAAATLESGEAPADAERLFNGKLIAALTALAEASGKAPLRNRGEQADVVLAAAAIAGLTVLVRAGRLKALGFDEQELIDRLDRRFSGPAPG